MYATRDPNERISNYSGPYERYVFSEELGQPFAFPAIAEQTSGYYTALLEGTDHLPEHPRFETRLPPLWNPMGRTRTIVPFAFYDKGANDPNRRARVDREVASLLDSVSAESAARSAIRPRFRVNFPIAPEAWTRQYHPHCDMDHWVVPHTRPKAIIAVIDDGLPFGHRAFLDSTGHTRVSHIWLQSARAHAANGHSAVPFGREFMNGDINALRAAAGDDETAFYRNSGAIDPVLDELGPYMRRAMTHGAHVMGMAAGNGPLYGDAVLGDDIQIIAVQLPNTIAWDTSGFGKEMYMLSAIHYVFDRARAIAAKYATDPAHPDELPLVLNFSYGWSAGRHDGQSEMELAIEQLLAERQQLQPETAITMPTGNNFDSQMHAALREEDLSGGAHAVGWQIQPEDRTSNYLEIWLPEGVDGADYSVTVSPPNGFSLSSGGAITLTPELGHRGDPRRFTELEMNGQNIGQLSADLHRGNRWRVLIALIPSAYVRNQTRRAPAGRWQIEISRRPGAPALPDGADIRFWVQRDDDPSALQTGGRQSRLVDLTPRGPGHARPPAPPYRLYSTAIKPISGFGSLSGVGSAPRVTRVAGYVQSSGQPASYSAAGGLRHDIGGVQPWGAQTTISAVADHSRVLRGTPSIGCYSGGQSRLVGTSGATPQVARLMVINAAAGRSLTEGCLPCPPLLPQEEQNDINNAQHTARLGSMIAPAIGFGAPRARSSS